ncbi:hypothetical protein OQA88_3242 [Cercophora sp. LCS_1]
MLSKQFIQTGQISAQLQNRDFDTLFLTLSRLSLGDKSSQDDTNINETGMETIKPPQPDENVIFRNSSYFENNTSQTSLPRPAVIRDHATFLSSNLQANTEGITHVPIRSQRLLVKYGTKVSIAEATCLVRLRHLLGTRVPLPEVFGWCRDGNETFIYMELPDGMNLSEAWAFLTDGQKMDISNQIRDMVAAWRDLEQDDAQDMGRGWVGNPSHGPLQDAIFTELPCQAGGPFPTVADFHAWFISTAMQASAPRQGRSTVAFPFNFQPNPLLHDNIPVSFTHGSLHPGNIIISTGTTNPRVVAVLDWSQAGWYPGYWEVCKARKAVRLNGSALLRGWESAHLPWILNLGRGGMQDEEGTYHCWDFLVELLGRAN